MTDITPPSSHSGTPVRGSGHLEKRSPGSNDHSITDDAVFGSQVNRGPSLSTPEQEMEELVDTDGSEDEVMDQDQDQDQGQDGVDLIEGDHQIGSDSSEPGAIPTHHSSAIKTGKTVSAPSKRTMKPNASTKIVKGKKKDTDLFEHEIVARWNREFGDVCAESPKATA